MTLKEYIAKRRRSRTHMGTFVEDAKRDRTFPETVDSWTDLYLYLLRVNACDGAIEAGKKVWKAYKSSLRAIKAKDI